MEAIRNNIKSERSRLDMTQEKLAEKLGVDSCTIRDWEKGNSTIKSSNLVAMSDLFDCTTDYLLALTNERTRDA